ncbi:MAG TPA: hypothetical protein VFE42_00595 [Chloroflexota bacterium]|nr:hypothetical protein [Chloroflexota bacterium]
MTVTGANFNPRELVGLFWDTASSPLTTTTSAANGAVSARFLVPMTPAGTYYLIAYGLQSHRWSYRRFVVRPRTLLAKPSAAAGTPNTLYVFGFGAHQTVNVYWRAPGPGGTLLGTLTTNTAGFATLSFTTPSGAARHRLAPTSTSAIYNVLSLGPSIGGISSLLVSS